MFYNFNPMYAFKSQMESQVKNNPQFQEFYEKNKNKSIEQVCQEYGLDYNTISKLVATKLK